jgi:hypothetical protein
LVRSGLFHRHHKSVVCEKCANSAKLSQTQRYSAKELGLVSPYAAIRSRTQTNSAKLRETRLEQMGFRGSRVQIPPSRLGNWRPSNGFCCGALPRSNQRPPFLLMDHDHLSTLEALIALAKLDVVTSTKRLELARQLHADAHEASACRDYRRCQDAVRLVSMTRGA